MSKTILVIPDSHAHPDFGMDRYVWLGKMIVEMKPDIVVNLGDLADMPSLCSYDKGTKGFEGRRYALDIKANIDANKAMFGVLDEYNEHRRSIKQRLYKPHTVLTLGNHENRINRAVEEEAILDGTISMSDLGNEEYWDTVVPFLEPIVIEGIAFQHYFTSGVMNRAISGEHPAHSCLIKKHMSCISGHSHLRDFCERSTADGRRIMSLVCGVYQDYEADYAGPANKLWWSGVAVLRNVQDGEFNHEWISMATIKEKYDGS